MKLIWMSDLHVSEDRDVQGHDTQVRLQLACDYIERHHPDANACIISGDLVNHGTETGYKVMRNHLERLSIPHYPMVGNHDHRALFDRAFDLPVTRMDEFAQYYVDIGQVRLIFLDTQDEGKDSGRFCEARKKWLRDIMSTVNDRQVCLFMHHPPMPLGLPMQDQDKMVDGDAFLDLLACHPNPRHMFIGHVHRPICGTVRGIPFATLPAVSYQAPAPWPAWDWDSFVPAQEAPKMAVLSIVDGDTQIHYVEFCSYADGVENTKSVSRKT